ncbi:GH25 family lysozyme [Saccharopolyspora montiporae]|uniref:GH25 family lysozyme n=1 Tax=Saccharopolyspora montiporae TaxID=2781240 RepID=UPI00351C27EA
MKPESPDQPGTPETNDHVSTPEETDDRGLRSAAMRTDHTLRSAVDRVRPTGNRVGAWLAPLFERIRQWLAPLIRTIQESSAFRSLQEKLAPRLAEARQKLSAEDGEGRSGSKRLRSMQLGAAVAAVGVVGLIIGGVSGQQGQGDETAQASPVQAAVPGQGGNTPMASPDPNAPNRGGAPEPPAPLGPPVEGIDVSNHNGDIDWKQVKADGKEFSFVLASDGTSFSNPMYDEQYHGAKDAGLITGAYHFARPDDSGAAEQANRFLDVAQYQNDGKTLPPVLDLEVDPNSGGCYNKSVDEMHAWTDEFSATVKDRTGHEPIIYANPSFWQQCMGSTDSYGDHSLWLASYGVDEPQIPNGFNDWDFWQYSESGSVAGIEGDTDLNIYDEGIERLRQLAS